MRKATLALLFFAFTIGATAQYTTLAELKKEVADHPEEDTARVNRLLECAFVIYFSNDERQKFAEEALSISRKINYTHGENYAMTYVGYFKRLKGDPEGALMIKQADSMARQNGDSTIIALLTYRAANILLNRGDKAGMDTMLKAEKLFARLNNYQRLASCQAILGNNYQINYSNYPAAMEYLLKAKASEEKAVASGVRPLTSDIATQIYNAFGTLYLLLGDYDKALAHFLKTEKLVKESGGDVRRTDLPNSLGEVYRLTGKYPEALAAYKEGVEPNASLVTMETYESNVADVYVRMNNLPLAFQYGLSSLAKGIQLQDDFTLGWIHSVLARAYLKNGMPDSSVYHAQQGLVVSTRAGTIEFMRDNALALSNAYAFKKDYINAYKFHQQYVSTNDSMLSAEVKNRTAVLEYGSDLEKKQAQITQLSQQQKIQQNFLYSSMVVLALILITVGLLLRNNRQKQKANKLLLTQKEEIDRKAHELEESYKNVELLGEIGRKVTSSLSVEKIISTVYDNVNSLMDAVVFGIGIYNEAKQQIEFPATYEDGQVLPFYTNAMDDKNRFAAVCLSSGQEIIMGNLNAEYSKYVNEIATPHAGGQPVSLIFLPLILKDVKLGVITVQSFKPDAYSDYQLYMLRNIAVYTAIALENAESYEELNHTIDRLKSTQAQLIQSEKMASLGELTAGIAHEIQNPLNFVNNFSEVSDEMINEMITEIDLGNTTEIKAIAGDVKQNLGKIIYHGKRADSIVKGMLQHTQSSTGAKEPTDINALAEEYLRLSYHGLRAKDKSFNSNIKTEFDYRIGKIWVVPQDIGRVLLNLVNNAFYAVAEKKKNRQLLKDAMAYDPMVIVTTQKFVSPSGVGGIEIRVKDNGNGISQRILDKIFQPFFTTKPAGQGTGLGLSLAYDIITKGHDGELKVITKEGEGSEFIIQLPDRLG